MALPHREFAKGRRVTQAVIVVNKRLPEVLAHVEERHDELRPPRVTTTGEKAGYVKRGRAVVVHPPAAGLLRWVSAAQLLAASAQASLMAG